MEDMMMEVLEENLTRISALSDVLSLASMQDESLRGRAFLKTAELINELAEKSLEALFGEGARLFNGVKPVHHDSNKIKPISKISEEDWRLDSAISGHRGATTK